ncbi:MAG: cytosine permease, partial [Mycobacterium sp.]
LVDYYLVQHGTYDVPAMYVKSGPYWYNPATWTYHGFNLKVLLAYFAGVLSGFPFVSSAWFKGPLADRFDGADLSWIPGLAVTAVVYLALAYRSRTTTVAPSQFAPVTPDSAAL